MELGKLHIIGASKEQENILQGRHDFVKAYCDEHNLDMENLSFEQILEIRKQDGWKNPKI